MTQKKVEKNLPSWSIVINFIISHNTKQFWAFLSGQNIFDYNTHLSIRAFGKENALFRNLKPVKNTENFGQRSPFFMR